MEASLTVFEGVILIEHDVFKDMRGWFMETYSYAKMRDMGIGVEFIQDNHSFSERSGTIRGLHFQKDPKAQSKLVRCSRGSILDVIVDIRRGSPTYGKWIGVELTENNRRSIFIPRGYAHGYVTLMNSTEVQYKVDNAYDIQMERTIRYDDPEIGIKWPIKEPIISAKDLKGKFLDALDNDFTYL